jgi:hypothetical protein
MATKIISITTLSLFALISLGLSPVYASEVTGTLSSGVSQSSDSSSTGSLSGSVVGGSTVTGTVSNSGSSGRSGGSNRSGGGNSGGEVLGASTDIPTTTNTYPGLPDTGMSETESLEFTSVLVAILVLSIIPLALNRYKKV